MVRDLCQEIRVLLYDGSRCTYCGRCAEVCPEKAIVMTPRFEQATDDRNDITENLELFMLTCQRCGRCYDMETTSAIDKLGLTGYRYDSLEARTVIRKATDSFRPKELEATERYERPGKTGD
jgi:hydrogenase-4 component H